MPLYTATDTGHQSSLREYSIKYPSPGGASAGRDPTSSFFLSLFTLPLVFYTLPLLSRSRACLSSDGRILSRRADLSGEPRESAAPKYFPGRIIEGDPNPGSAADFRAEISETSENGVVWANVLAGVRLAYDCYAWDNWSGWRFESLEIWYTNPLRRRRYE